MLKEIIVILEIIIVILNMSIFRNKNRRHMSTVPKYETEVTSFNTKTDRNHQASVNLKTVPEYGSYDSNQYLNELVKENERLQNIIEDSKITNKLSKQVRYSS